jgi:hypothetical protein
VTEVVPETERNFGKLQPRAADPAKAIEFEEES